MFKYLKCKHFLNPLLKQANKYNVGITLFYNRLEFFKFFLCSLCKKNKLVKKKHNFLQEKVFRCGKCETNVVNILDADMFQTFGIEYSFEIDKKFLESKYKELIKLSHPDIDENVNMEIPIHIIRSYKLLHDPFERALLIISKKTNTTKEYLIDKIDSLTMDLKVMDDVFDTDMNIKEIEAGEMRKRDLTSIVERNDKKISEYIKLLETEFKRKDLEVTNILKILKNLKIYQKLNLKLSGA